MTSPSQLGNYTEDMSSALQAPAFRSKLRTQLLDRRERLQATISALHKRKEHQQRKQTEEAEDLVRLLGEVDSALSRLEGAEFGVCRVCLLPVADDDLLANPMVPYCLCELTSDRQRALERDLDLAWRVQSALLPPLGLFAAGWKTHYRYVPHGPVSGDYCDLVVTGENPLDMYFMLGDVSGKGVAASLLMAHLNALLRSLANERLSPEEIMTRANRTLAKNMPASHYATMICGRANASGEVEVVNAGHCKPLIVRDGGAVDVLSEAGLPLGLAVDGELLAGRYTSQRMRMNSGDTLVLHTDGLSEAANWDGDDYGAERLHNVLSQCAGDSPRDLISICLTDLADFLGGADRLDDLTILAIARASE
jgi:sigma-B regulation protein RsbU (phosphoserine phosphatase)